MASRIAATTPCLRLQPFVPMAYVRATVPSPARAGTTPAASVVGPNTRMASARRMLWPGLARSGGCPSVPTSTACTTSCERIARGVWRRVQPGVGGALRGAGQEAALAEVRAGIEVQDRHAAQLPEAQHGGQRQDADKREPGAQRPCRDGAPNSQRIVVRDWQSCRVQVCAELYPIWNARRLHSCCVTSGAAAKDEEPFFTGYVDGRLRARANVTEIAQHGYLTPEAQWGDVERGNPLPYTLPPDAAPGGWAGARNMASGDRRRLRHGHRARQSADHCRRHRHRLRHGC